MCGIAGYLHQHPTPNQVATAIATAAKTLRHRGPDDEGYYLHNGEAWHTLAAGSHTTAPLAERQPQILSGFGITPKIALAHRRLAIIDLSPQGHQPMLTSDGRFAMVYNGEVYNYLQLREQLKKLGYQFHSQSDSEVVLYAWHAWGTEALHKFDGMYALSIWDSQLKKLYLATDPLGVKPLYYFHGNEVFVFASEIKALLAVEPHLRSMHRSTVLDFLLFGKLDHNQHTCFEHVYHLPGGHLLEYDFATHRQHISAWYKLPYNDRYGSTLNKELHTCIQHIQHLLRNSIEAHLMADVPVATTLSGGLDSSVIFAHAYDALLKNRPQGAPLHVFTVAFKDDEADETPFVNAMLAGKQVIRHSVQPHMQEFEKDMQALTESFESPMPGMNAYAHFVLMRSVHEAGIKVVLDGQGADELFAGYAKHYDALLFTLFSQHKWKSFFENYFKGSNNYFSPNAWVLRWLRHFMPHQLEWALHPARKIIHPQLMQHLVFENDSGYAWHPHLNETLLRDSLNGILSFLLKAADHTSMHFSVESRVPFADSKTLLEYVHSLPYNYKIQHGITKYLLREAAKPLLPYTIYTRYDKKGFSVPQRLWLKQIKQTAVSLLEGLPQGLLNTEAVCKQYDDWAASPHLHDKLWRAISFALWYEHFIK